MVGKASQAKAVSIYGSAKLTQPDIVYPSRKKQKRRRRPNWPTAPLLFATGLYQDAPPCQQFLQKKMFFRYIHRCTAIPQGFRIKVDNGAIPKEIRPLREWKTLT